ncbi:hypothetical protein G7081_07550 [Vagococcus coleopterorum]|uniref:Uncharacterized protein n=1 Tax=Vagococcus coleopterorum TaxID=2714946 RepID=A0A6G8APE0_9ENTE|nr:hypothetical protein [Vagococcus coleopterorum]QIL46941.1 hypothetical protein G7081_07550 [Vagococcus coleopterorum]
MSLPFITIKEVLPDESIHTFLNFISNTDLLEDFDFFLFDQEMVNRRFKTSVKNLASEMTVQEEDFPEDTHVVAMTIDGDFILASNHYVYVVTKNLIAEDIEVYDLTPIDFFVAFEANMLASTILPNE